jgi:hypothetical protein
MLGRDVPLGLVEVHVLSPDEQQFALAHHGQQDQVQADLDLPADVGFERRLQERSNLRTARSRASSTRPRSSVLQ